MSRLAQQLNQAWLRRGWLACTLWPLHLVMRALVSLRRQGYRLGWLRSEQLPVPVIVVGNRVVGGAGKTPTTIALLQHLQARGWRPGVLSRGYKARAGQPGPILIDAHSAPGLSADDTGDEPLLVWRRTAAPLMVGRDRAASGRALLAQHPEVNLLVCDDGLQHLRLRRELEIVVFDERGAGNGWLLPAGPLREPISAPPPPGLLAPPIVLYNTSRPSTHLPGHPSQHRMRPLSLLQDWWQGRDSTRPLQARDCEGRPVWAAAGIAHPQRFFDALRQQGFCVEGLPLDDHASFDTLPWPAQAGDVIVTEKDAVKLMPDRVAAQCPGCRVWVAALDLHPDGTFWTVIDAALAQLPAPVPPGEHPTARHLT